MKIITVIGARPQFIKAAAVSRVLRQSNSGVEELIVHTGQHYDANMSDVFFNELDIPKPHANLGVGGGTHGQNTGRMLEALEAEMMNIRPDWVLVYGDTDSTLAGALAASKLHIPVAHVESGLRSFNRRMPEEINRVLTDHIAKLLFTPTSIATDNLRKEGLGVGKVIQVGDVMYDAVLFYRQAAKAPANLDLPPRFALSTLHRAENTDDPLRLAQIIEGLRAISATLPVVLPLHPRTRKLLQNGTFDLKGIHVVDPVGYLEMIWLLDHCELVVTDSGGLQKEAYFFQKPCLTTRDETEWVELVSAGVNVLVGANSEKITAAFHSRSWEQADFTQPLYGNGDSAQKILQALNFA